MRSFKYYYGNILDESKKNINSVKEDIKKRYPNHEFIERLIKVEDMIEQIKQDMSYYPM